jgi:hypothetical protein
MDIDKTLDQLYLLDSAMRLAVQSDSKNLELKDKVSQIRTCLLLAIQEGEQYLYDLEVAKTRGELNEVLDLHGNDTPEFLERVVQDQRPRVEAILVDIGAMESCPDTERSPTFDCDKLPE